MKTITLNIYQYDELSDAAKKKAVENENHQIITL